MNGMIYQALLILLSLWEVWMCYLFINTVMVIIEEQKWKQRIIKWGNIIALGTLLGVNRYETFCSSIMLVFSIFFTTYCTKIIVNKKTRVVAGLVGIYYIFLALFDFIFAFISIEYFTNLFRIGIYYGTYSVLKLVLYILSRTSMVVLILLIRKKSQYYYFEDIFSPNIIIMGSIILYFVFKKYQCILDGMVGGSRLIQGIEKSVSISLVLLLLILGSGIYFRFHLLQKEKDIVQVRDEILQEKIERMQIDRQVVHDMKNHVLMLQKYEEEQRWGDLQYYIHEIGQELFENGEGIQTGISDLDFLLNQKIIRAKKRGIVTEVDILPLKSIPVSIKEMVAVIGNLLDNAIEACEIMGSQEKWIRICIKRSHELFLLKIENSMENKKEQEERQKEIKKIHGYGLKSVRYIVNQNGGEIEYKKEKEMFQVKVLFYNE